MPGRLKTLLVLVYLAFAVFTLRLLQLQVFDYQRYVTQSRGNYLKTESIPAPRGRIYDRNGVLIATNRVAYDLVYSGGPVQFAGRIQDLLGLAGFPEVKGKPVVVAANIPSKLVPTLAELTAGQANLELRARVEREYPNPISGPVLGYVQEAGPADLKRGYEVGDLVGRAGLEAALEPLLRGKRGAKLVERDARGATLREIILKAPEPGQDITLTIDLRLQSVAERALQSALRDLNAGREKLGLPPETTVRGAVIAIDPENGEVLAMASAPDYDPNVFVRLPVPGDVIRSLIQNPAKPLLDRAVQTYPPGSTFKSVTASALLESGLVSPDTVYRCLPSIVFGGQVRRNWSSRDMGPMTVDKALAYSCNTWFYQAVIEAGPLKALDAIAARAERFGLGQATGLEISERTGLVPTRAWKQRTYGEPWYPGETLSVAIGQGPLLVSPAQMARAYAAIMTGKLPYLHLVKGRDEPATPIPGNFWRLIRQGLRETVTEGTASFRLKDFPVPTAGKTGTAETPGKRAGYEHAWYVGFGPYPEDPRYKPLVVVAFIENGGEGSRVALPVVKKIMAAYWGVGGITEADARSSDTQRSGRSAGRR